MIRVPKYPPPAKYNAEVLVLGAAYLARYPRPTPEQFKKHAYWSAIHPDIYYLYHGICSYCASWTPRKPGVRDDNTSIDHFIPKSVEPSRAYDWDNFRLCRSRINRKKGNAQYVIDPFAVPPGWFLLDFSSFLMKASDTVPIYALDRVIDTIECLGLNDNDYVNERIGVIRMYACDNCSFAEVQRRYPFIALEMTRVGFDVTLKQQMRTLFTSVRIPLAPP